MEDISHGAAESLFIIVSLTVSCKVIGLELNIIIIYLNGGMVKWEVLDFFNKNKKVWPAMRANF